MLTEAVGTHWHALVRDVIALGKDPDDMFITRDLSFAKMVSIVVASPPDSSLRWYIDGGWNRTDHLLANLQEQRAGIATLNQPYYRPGGPDPSETAVASSFFPAEAMSWEEMDRRDAERYKAAEERQYQPVGQTHSRIW
jgi:hypothetical protein